MRSGKLVEETAGRGEASESGNVGTPGHTLVVLRRHEVRNDPEEKLGR